MDSKDFSTPDFIPRELSEAIRSGDPKAAELIEALIEVRETQRDAALNELRRDMDQLIETLRSKARHLLLEEIACFKDIVTLHREGRDADSKRE